MLVPAAHLPEALAAQLLQPLKVAAVLGCCLLLLARALSALSLNATISPAGAHTHMQAAAIVGTTIRCSGAHAQCAQPLHHHQPCRRTNTHASSSDSQYHCSVLWPARSLCSVETLPSALQEHKHTCKQRRQSLSVFCALIHTLSALSLSTTINPAAAQNTHVSSGGRRYQSLCSVLG